MEINSLDKKSIYVHKRKDDKYFIENANADNVNIYVVLESRLINEEHQYYKLTIATIDVDDILDDSTRVDIRHLIFKLLLICAVDTNNCDCPVWQDTYKTFNAARISNNGLPVTLGFGKQSHNDTNKNLQLMISYDFADSRIIFWDDQAWVPISDTGSRLIESLIKMGRQFAKTSTITDQLDRLQRLEAQQEKGKK